MFGAPPLDAMPAWLKSGRYRTTREYQPGPAGEQTAVLLLLVAMLAYLVSLVRRREEAKHAVEVQMEAVVEMKDE